MSIYATLARFHLEGEDNSLTEIFVQAVPSFVGSYGADDPYPWLPGPATPERGMGYGGNYDRPYRGVYVVTAGSPKEGQRYPRPLMVLTDGQYHALSFPEFWERLSAALDAAQDHA